MHRDFHDALRAPVHFYVRFAPERLFFIFYFLNQMDNGLIVNSPAIFCIECLYRYRQSFFFLSLCFTLFLDFTLINILPRLQRRIFINCSIRPALFLLNNKYIWDIYVYIYVCIYTKGENKYSCVY